MTATVPIRQGTLTLPAEMCRLVGLTGEGQVYIEETASGLLLKPKEVRKERIYSDEEIAEFEAVNNDLGSDSVEVLAKLRAFAANRNTKK